MRGAQRRPFDGGAGEVSDLTRLEIAGGTVTGAVPGLAPLTSALSAPRLDPALALEAAVLPALRQPPCLVSFSGGLDSSLVLAVADAAARRNGLARPVPITFRFRDAPLAHEDEAQEAVIRAVGSPDWQRIEIGEELDLLGPIARTVLHEHGVLHPANAFLHAPLLDRARGGSLLTGIGGDQVLGGWRAIRRRRRPWWWPGRGAIGGRPAPDFAWLRPGVARTVRRAIARERAAQPRAFDARVAWQLQRRDLAVSLRSLRRLAATSGAAVLTPLVDPGFAAALARAGGAPGFGPPGLRTRPDLLAAVFPDLAPAVVAARRKALFHEVFWRAEVRGFLARWDGTGVDNDLVDATRLAALWRSPSPPRATALLIHATWLAQQAAPRRAEAAPGDTP